jgi:all-trans-retinol 13,14-reductase
MDEVVANDAPDVLILGAGISGLTCAILMAESGRSVVVLEQHSIPGGYLQQFRRKFTTFDVGFHWVGSTLPGRPFHTLLQHLQIAQDVEFEPYPADKAIEVRSRGETFAFPTSYDAFIEKAHARWPSERQAIDELIADVDETTSRYRWFHQKRVGNYDDSLFSKSDRMSLADRLEGRISDPVLREMLGLVSYNIGLRDHEIPWSKFALVFRSNFDDTSRVRGGGAGVVEALMKRGRELGVEYRFREGAAHLECEKRRVVAVETEKGNRIVPGMVLGACHPKTIFRMIDDDAIGADYKERIFRMRDSRGAIQLFARLKRPLTSIGREGILLGDEPPIGPLLVLHPDDGRLEAMAYADQKKFEKWRNLPVMRRGKDYEAYKMSLAKEMLARIAKVVPEVEDAIEDLYTATPLSDEWYTRNERGAVFGVSHDIGQQGMDRPMPRMRIKNLWFTGHSITMPGIMGVMINAFATCGALRGDDWLFDQIAS